MILSLNRSSNNRSYTTIYLLRWLIRTYSTTTNELHDIILKNEQLTSRKKRLLRDYWKTINNHGAALQKKTLLEQLPMLSLINFIYKNMKHSSTVRAAYRKEILFNHKIHPEKVKQFLNALGLPFEGKFSSQTILSTIVSDSLRTNDVTIAADLYLLYYKLVSDEPLDKGLCSEIITALSFQNPKYDHVHLLKYLEFHKLYRDNGTPMSLSPIQVATLCNKALSLDHSPILTKATLSQLMDIQTWPGDCINNRKMLAAYKLIEKDYKINNVSGVFLTWTKIKDKCSSITNHDPRILYKVMKMFTQNKAYRKTFKSIFQQIPPTYYCNNPLLLPSIIDYATKTKDLAMAQLIMDNVNKNIEPQNTQLVLFSRRCLSSLLRMHLKFNDSIGVDRVLKQLLDVYGNHSEENFFAVISHLVSVKKLENLNKAIKIVNSIPQDRALLSYGAILSKIIEWQIASEGKFETRSMPLVSEMLKKAHRQDPFHKSSLWDIVASLFIKKLVHYKNFQKVASSNNRSFRSFNTTNLDLAKLIYTRSIQNHNCSSDADHNPFASSYPHKVILKLNNNNTLPIIRNIALSAIKGRRKDIFLWCCYELYRKGVPLQELLITWNTTLKHQFRSNQCLTMTELNEILAKNGSSLIKNALK